MVSDGKTMRFIINASDQPGEVAVISEPDVLGDTIVQANQFNCGIATMIAVFVATDVWDAGRIKQRREGAKLWFPAVNQDYVWVRPLGMLEATFQDLMKVFKIIVALIMELELTIFGTIGNAISKNNHGANYVGAGLMRDIIAFNAARRFFEI